MQSLFITATNTNVGKTYTTIKLIEAFSKHQIKVGIFKPIETGVIDTIEDASALLKACQANNPNFLSLTPKDITAYTFNLPAAPFCADSKQEIKRSKIIEKYETLSKLCDILLVEGAGGLLVPITKEFKMIDLAKTLKSKVLLVTPSKLGCINDTLLSMEALKKRDLPFDWCVNIYEDKEHFNSVTQPYYDAVFPNWWSIDRGLEAYINLIKDERRKQ